MRRRPCQITAEALDFKTPLSLVHSVALAPLPLFASACVLHNGIKAKFQVLPPHKGRRPSNWCERLQTWCVHNENSSGAAAAAAAADALSS
jgi:hypothetical protein